MKRRQVMEKRPAVSVIMSVYDPSPFCQLEAALGSVLEQTFADFELLLYNDGSNEAASEKMRQLARSDARILYLESEKNRGIASGLNRCIEKARGKYIARMDGDDLLLRERLEVQVRFLELNGQYDFVGTGAWLFDEGGIWGERLMKEKPEKEDFLPFSPYIHPTVMFRRSVFEKCGLYNESEKVRRCEDYELFVRLHILGCYGYNLQEKLICYREGKDSWKKRRFCYRLDEMRFRREGFQALGLTGGKAWLCRFRPLAAGLVPRMAGRWLKRRQAVCRGEERIWTGPIPQKIQ